MNGNRIVTDIFVRARYGIEQVTTQYVLYDSTGDVVELRDCFVSVNPILSHSIEHDWFEYECTVLEASLVYA